MDETIDALRWAIRFVNQRIINRAEVINQLFCALLTGEHALIQSRTGAAKSLLVMQIFSMFDGANVFKIHASKEQQPDSYFGGLLIDELKEGRIVHNTKDSLVESEFAFIDEIFDANDYTLRALLTTLNERALILGVQNVPARVHTVIAATNYLRVSEITEGILDRFVYKSLFLPAKVPYTQYQISRRYQENMGKPTEPERKIPYQVLERASRIIKGEDPEITIHIPLEVIFFANLVVRTYEIQRNRLIKERPQDYPHLKDYYISPRTQAKAIDLLRVSAFLQGRTEVVNEDAANLWYMFAVVGNKDQRELFQRSYDTILRQYAAVNAFPQVREMLEFGEFMETLKKDPSLLKRPLTQIESNPIRRTLAEWAKETLGLADASVEYNRRLLEGYLKRFSPLTEEIHELKIQQEKDLYDLFAPPLHL